MKTAVKWACILAAGVLAGLCVRGIFALAGVTHASWFPGLNVFSAGMMQGIVMAVVLRAAWDWFAWRDHAKLVRDMAVERVRASLDRDLSGGQND